MVFAHGFGCDQAVWRHIAPAFESDWRVVVFDFIGAGSSDLSYYEDKKYASLDGYADDVLTVIDSLGGGPVTFVGHSVSAMMGACAATRRSAAFNRLIMVGPSPCYINDPSDNYIGGFEAADIDGLLETLDSNYLGWSRSMAPVIIGNPDRPELGQDLANSFCRTDPEIAKKFARVTFLSDSRQQIQALTVPTLIMQCSDDLIAPDTVGQYLNRKIAGSRFVKLVAKGHCPQLSEPAETIQVIRTWLATD